MKFEGTSYETGPHLRLFLHEANYAIWNFLKNEYFEKLIIFSIMKAF
jgi:hypothetical protein